MKYIILIASSLIFISCVDEIQHDGASNPQDTELDFRNFQETKIDIKLSDNQIVPLSGVLVRCEYFFTGLQTGLPLAMNLPTQWRNKTLERRTNILISGPQA